MCRLWHLNHTNMKKKILYIIIVFISFICISCNNNDDDFIPPAISGTELKGSWFRDCGDLIYIYDFNGEGKVFLSAVSKKHIANMYFKGIYTIDGENINIYLYDTEYREYELTHEFKFKHYKNDILTVKENDIDVNLLKITHNVTIDLEVSPICEFTTIFDDEEIISYKSFDTEIVGFIGAKQALRGYTHGETFVVVETRDCEKAIRVNVKSKGFDSIENLVKLLGMPFSKIKEKLGEPNEESDVRLTYKIDNHMINLLSEDGESEEKGVTYLYINISNDFNIVNIFNFLYIYYLYMEEQEDGDLVYYNGSSYVIYNPMSNIVKIASSIYLAY